MVIGRNFSNARPRNYNRRFYTGYAKPTSFEMSVLPIKAKHESTKTSHNFADFAKCTSPPVSYGSFVNPPVVSKRTAQRHGEEPYYGELCCSTEDGVQWFIIPVKAEHPDGMCMVNRLSGGHIVVIQKRFSKKAIASEYCINEKACFEGKTVNNKSSEEDDDE